MMLWIVAKVPLAEHARDVTRLSKRVGDGDLIKRKCGHVVDRPQRPTLPVESIDTADGVHAGPRTVLPAHERCASRLTIGTACVAVGEFHTIGGELVDVWRLVVLATEAGDVDVAQVVRENEHDIGL